VCVRWRNSVSTSFHIGGILSPTLFSRYIRDLLVELAKLQVGCNIGGLFVNVLAYADDLVLLAQWSALQQLLTALEQHIDNIDMVCNAKKSVCMIFEPCERSFPQFMIGGSLLQYVKVFKYLGHMIIDTLYDDEALQREIRLTPGLGFDDQYAFRPTGSTTAAVIALFHTICTMLSTNHFVHVFTFDV